MNIDHGGMHEPKIRWGTIPYKICYQKHLHRWIPIPLKTLSLPGQHVEHDQGFVCHCLRWMAGRSWCWIESCLPYLKLKHTGTWIQVKHNNESQVYETFYISLESPNMIQTMAAGSSFWTIQTLSFVIPNLPRRQVAKSVVIFFDARQHLASMTC